MKHYLLFFGLLFILPSLLFAQVKKPLTSVQKPKSPAVKTIIKPPMWVDLQIISTSVNEAVVEAGGGITINYTIKNNNSGSLGTAAASVTKFYLSRDAVLQRSTDLEFVKTVNEL